MTIALCKNNVSILQLAQCRHNLIIKPNILNSSTTKLFVAAHTGQLKQGQAQASTIFEFRPVFHCKSYFQSNLAWAIAIDINKNLKNHPPMPCQD
ncbi:hypothetical protein [Thalassoporum mexicanum]|uniref:hypothetical protein n=1 Tax=Thalassoporum mexicanum TaxID=3457544 RepID=UPI0005A24955|nr:hypothetical protein [Pseudanabaena sp. PCC 7367]